MPTPPSLRLDGRSLRLDDLAPLLRGELPELIFDPAAIERVRASRRLVAETVERGDVVYGLTTGFGKLKNAAIAPEDLEELQQNLILSHCCGSGELLSPDEARCVWVLRLNGLLRGHSGVRVELIEAWQRLFAKGFVPCIPVPGVGGRER